MTRVYIDMVADLFHVGHLNIIKKAKSLGDILLVGIHSDKDVQSYKRLPIINHADRVSLIESCKYVDLVIPNAPLIITKDFINKHEISLVVHGDDTGSVPIQQHLAPRELGIMKYLPYTSGVSTSDIITKIQTREV